MGSLDFVVDKPSVEIELQRLDRVVEGFQHLHPEKLIEDHSVESLDEAVGLRLASLGPAVLDAVQVEGAVEGPCFIMQHRDGDAAEFVDQAHHAH